MPTVIFISKTRHSSETFTLDLVVRHRLQAGEPSAKARVLKNAPPPCIDVVLGSSLTMMISGKFNGTRAPLENLRSSRVALHLVQYLRMNSTELGLENISELYISEDNNLTRAVHFSASSTYADISHLTVSCTSSRVCRHMDTGLPHIQLLGFDLEYIWTEKSFSNSQDSCAVLDASVNPFSRQLALPYVTAIDNVLDRFVTFQVVKRYPLIFASWCRQLDTEQEFIASLFTSLRSIAKRSGRSNFLEVYNKHLKSVKRSMTLNLASTQSTLSDYLSADLSDGPPRLDDETAFKLSMEHVFRTGMKRRQFKSVAVRHSVSDSKDEDELLDASHSPTSTVFDEELHSSESDNDGDLASYLVSPTVDVGMLSDCASELDLLDDETSYDSPSAAEQDVLPDCASPLKTAGSDKESDDTGGIEAHWEDDDMDGYAWDFSSQISPATPPLWDADICHDSAWLHHAKSTGFSPRNEEIGELSRDADLGDAEITPDYQQASLSNRIPVLSADLDLFDEDTLANPTFTSSITSSSVSSSPGPRTPSQRLENSYRGDPCFSDDLTNDANTLAETCGNFNSWDDFSGMIFDNEDDADGHVQLGSIHGWTTLGFGSGKEGSCADGVIAERDDSLAFQNVDCERPMGVVPSVPSTTCNVFPSLPMTALDAVQDLEFSAMEFDE